MKRILMIAFHYPPSQISSGIQRTLKFTTYLRDHDWEPAVLSAHPRAYPNTSDDQIGEIPQGIQVKRAFALDTSRHLTIRGRYPMMLALPDRWSSWVIGGVLSGLRLIRQWQPDIIWSTYPIATAHWIGLSLHRLSGLPWVADCRDSMTEEGYPAQPARRNAYLRIERQAVKRASRLVFTTRGTARMYAGRYPEISETKWAVIANGYDEENFRAAEASLPATTTTGPKTLIHSGLLYPSERDPRPFFDAVAELAREGRINAQQLCIRLRATGYDAQYQPMIDARGISDIISLAPAVGYRQALMEMLVADGLLIFQAASCNHQIPAKLFDYLRARRPILALTDAAGDSAALMREAGIDTIVSLDDKEAIKREIVRFLGLLEQGHAPVPAADFVQRYSRRARTAELAELLDEVMAEGVRRTR